MKYRIFENQILLIPQNWFDDLIIKVANEVADCEMIDTDDKLVCYVAVNSIEDWHIINAEIQNYIMEHLEEMLEMIDTSYEKFMEMLESDELMEVEELEEPDEK